MAVNLLANLEGVSGSVHPTELNHPQPATNGKGTGGGISRHTSRRPEQGARPSEPCPNVFADGRSQVTSSFPCAG